MMNGKMRALTVNQNQQTQIISMMTTIQQILIMRIIGTTKLMLMVKMMKMSKTTLQLIMMRPKMKMKMT